MGWWRARRRPVRSGLVATSGPGAARGTRSSGAAGAAEAQAVPKREKPRCRDGDGRPALRGDRGTVSTRQGHNKWMTAERAGRLLGEATARPGWPSWELAPTNILPKTKMTPSPKQKTSPRHQTPSHPAQKTLPGPARCRPRLTRAPGTCRGCCSATAALWAAGLPGAAIRAAADGFFCIRGVSALDVQSNWRLRGPPQSPAFSPRSISPVRGFSSS